MYGTIQNKNFEADNSYSATSEPQSTYQIQNIPQYPLTQNLTTYNNSQNYQQQSLQYNQQDVTQPTLNQYVSNYPQYNTETINTAVSQNQAYQPQNSNESQTTFQNYQIQQPNPIYSQHETSNQMPIQPPSSNQSSIQSQQIPISNPIQPTQSTSKPEPKLPSKNSNIDLLLGIDFLTNTPSDLDTEILQPESLKPLDTASDILIPTPAPSIIDSKSQVDTKVPTEPQAKIQSYPKSTTPIETNDRIREFILSNTNNERKSSLDNLSNISDLSSTDQNYDWESASAKNDDTSKSSRDDNLTVILMKYKNPFDDQKVLKNFHKEIERLEKLIEMLNVKNLNGTTQLDGKWKDLQDLLVSLTVLQC